MTLTREESSSLVWRSSNGGFRTSPPGLRTQTVLLPFETSMPTLIMIDPFFLKLIFVMFPLNAYPDSFWLATRTRPGRRGYPRLPERNNLLNRTLANKAADDAFHCERVVQKENRQPITTLLYHE